MDINVVYSGHNGPPSLHHQGELGSVHVSEKRDPTKYNVFTHLVKPEPNDCFLMQEPIVVRPEDYNTDNLKDFHKVFTWFTGFNLPNIVKIDFPTSLDQPSANDLRKNPSWTERNDEIVIIANPKHSNHKASIYKLREILADELYKKGFNISWYAHTKLNKPYYKGTIQDKISVLKKAKFSICSENTYDSVYSKNYLTEKLPHCIYAGCVPLYMGCYNIEEFFNSTFGFIDLRDYVNINNKINVDIDKLSNTIKNFTESDYCDYRKSTYLEAFNNDDTYKNINYNGLFYKTSYHTAYETMLRALNK